MRVRSLLLPSLPSPAGALVPLPLELAPRAWNVAARVELRVPRAMRIARLLCHEAPGAAYKLTRLRAGQEEFPMDVDASVFAPAAFGVRLKPVLLGAGSLILLEAVARSMEPPWPSFWPRPDLWFRHWRLYGRRSKTPPPLMVILLCELEP